MKTACDLDESVFMRVDDTARNAFPRCINDRTSSYRIGTRVKENMIVGWRWSGEHKSCKEIVGAGNMREGRRGRNRQNHEGLPSKT